MRGFGSLAPLVCTGAAGDKPKVFEALGEYDNAIAAAHLDLVNWPLHPFMRVQSFTSLGRAHAKLGQTQEAEAAFEQAIEIAHGCQLHLLECFALRDFVKFVLKPNGNAGAARVSQCKEGLRNAMGKMVGTEAEYEAMLGISLA